MIVAVLSWSRGSEVQSARLKAQGTLFAKDVLDQVISSSMQYPTS
jgi:hypothetical protein